MINEDVYNQYIKNIIHFFHQNYPQCRYCFKNSLDKIKFYTTKYYVNLPEELDRQLNEVLQYDIAQNPVLNVNNIDKQVSVCKEDITQIITDAIVNAANEDGMGCFLPDHKCIDNIIHNRAGPRLRLECKQLLNGSKLETSGTLLTGGHNLPAKYIIHTVGPVYDSVKHKQCCVELTNCYTNCLRLADKYGMKSIVFCCISTGVFGFPADTAAKLAVAAVNRYLSSNESKIKVIFCTYNDNDYKLYKKLVSN